VASPIRAVLFDLDGTLVDSYGLIAEAFQHACRTVMGREITEAELLTDWGAPAPARFSRIDPERVQELVDAYTSYYEVHLRRVRLFPGVRETLEDLAARGCRMAIVTSKGRGRARQTLQALDLARFFAAVVDAQDIQAPKPSPDAILVALGRLESRPEEALMVGDSLLDIEAARAAGVRSAAAMWGTPEADALRAARPDYELESPVEVAGLVASAKQPTRWPRGRRRRLPPSRDRTR
jgi:3-amino-5-hydroxybenzoic acid synthesis related protein